MRDYDKRKEKIIKAPRTVVLAYLKSWGEKLTKSDATMERLPEARQLWTWAQACEASVWGRLYDCKRAWWMIACALQHLPTQEKASKTTWQAMAMLVQCLKGLGRAAIDGGSWRYAWPLATLQEPGVGQKQQLK